ncbi:MAG: bifunctional phosphoribosyl-AMP cyclohydrolase/phosphoribosyl-ATP diphosphatase HisIE [Lachnospiraceae bacterium]
MAVSQIIPVLYFSGNTCNNDLFFGDTVKAVECYQNNGADGVLLLDCSSDDMQHDASIGVVKEIVKTMEIPVYLGGNLHRLEDIKKYLYAGAVKAVADAASETECQVAKEGAERFGADRVLVCDYKAEWKDAEYLTKTLDELGMNSEKKDANLHLSNPDIEKFAEGYIFVTASMEFDFYACKQSLKARGVSVVTWESQISWSEFKLNSDGLIPVIVQDYRTNQVLMLAYMNQAAFEETVAGGKMCYFSRSRQARWLKGETSGHFQYVKALYLDCDNDTILAKVAQVGAACHTGSYSCFFKTLVDKKAEVANPYEVFEKVYAVIADRKVHPKEGSYTNYLFNKGIDKILKKCGEEATEIVIAAKNPDPEEVIYEVSDFLYHVMVLMVEKGLTWEDITRELANRE